MRESGLVAKDVQSRRSFSSLPVEILPLVPEWTLRLGILGAKAACRTHPEYSQLQHQSFALAHIIYVCIYIYTYKYISV